MIFSKKKKDEAAREQAEKKAPQTLKQWLWSNVKEVAGIVAVVLLIKTFVFEIYVIPTGSMESNLMAGDRIVALRPIYGPRLPQTLLQFPFTHQKFWYTDTDSYLDWVQLPRMELPGIRDVRRHESVIFNYPGMTEEEYARPSDMRMYYIKRCVALPGDKLEIKGGLAYVNGEKEPDPDKKQFGYRLYSNTQFSEDFFESNDLRVERMPNGRVFAEPLFTGQIRYVVHEDEEAIVDRLRGLSQIDSLTPYMAPEGRPQSRVGAPLFPLNPDLFKDWNRDWMGPFTVPKEGMSVPMTPENISLYGKVIKRYEGNEDVEISADFLTLKIGGQKVEEYVFKQDYYFMMGDNRHNSTDSRFWGFAPADHVVACPVMVIFSKKTYTGSFSGYRFGRIGTLID